ncbi:hypothetical protein PIB30_035726 [Stylosanthes scabra]|uniref:Uncharacterized protein n=1 Tax=Stylosanthes scabra TaxID=79078 RepID=A0ABU6YAJ1_9FABA|nr:hypothetical protein [Stylosanthes scabra]
MKWNHLAALEHLVIRLHPDATVHEREDGVWFQYASLVVFQHSDMSTMSEFVHLLVWLFNDEHVRVTFGCHRRLIPQYVMDFLVQLGDRPHGPPVAATPMRIAEPTMPEADTVMDKSDSESDYSASSGSSSSDSDEGDDCIPKTQGSGCPRYILPAPPPIPRLEDVSCFFQQLDLDDGECDDPLRVGMCNYYNTYGGAELRVGHRMRNRDAV